MTIMMLLVTFFSLHLPTPLIGTGKVVGMSRSSTPSPSPFPTPSVQLRLLFQPLQYNAYDDVFLLLIRLCPCVWCYVLYVCSCVYGQARDRQLSTSGTILAKQMLVNE